MQVVQQGPLPELQAALRDHGVVAGLRWLNGRVAHRCTAIYQLKASTIRLQYLFDRQGQTLPKSMAVVPLTDSYC